MLNMTRMALQTQTSGMAELTVVIDLGQSLMTPAAYWTLSQAPPGQQEHLAAEVLAQLDRHIKLLAGDRSFSKTLVSWQFEAASLAAVANTMTPQMATLVYRADLQDAEQVSVQLDDTLQIPWPCLVRIDISGAALPASRLLTDSNRITRPMQLTGSINSTSDLLALAIHKTQALLPGLSWVAVGFQHIIPQGLDHIAFILGLFFLATGLMPLLWQVTGFTLAHSLTLGLSMYGLISAPANIVEPFIALSIIYVAVDNLYASKLAPFRFSVVCLFGLLHGLGFASALRDFKLPEDQFLTALGLFNLGVELAQLTVLLVAFMLLGWFRRRSWYEPMVAHPATVAIAGTGTYWLLTRTLF